MKRAVASIAGLMAAVALGFWGCATALPAEGTISLAPSSSSSSSSSWLDELNAATRRVEPYDWAMRQADLRATLVTPRLRKAFLDERVRFHGRFATETHQELVGFGSVDEGVDADVVIDRPKGEEEVLVFVAMYVADQKNRSLSTRSSIWDTALVRGSTRIKPTKIESIRLSPAVVDVFPYVDRFDDLYLFRFPLVDPQSGLELLKPGEDLRFEARSALADCVVEWGLQE